VTTVKLGLIQNVVVVLNGGSNAILDRTVGTSYWKLS